MRVAIPSIDNRGLDSEVCRHFGRASYFTFVDIENGKIKNVVVAQVPFEEHGPGDLPNFIKENGGEVVIAYGMGNRAIEFFESLGIDVVTGASGKVGDVVRAIINQMLETDPYWKEKIEREKH